MDQRRKIFLFHWKKKIVLKVKVNNGNVCPNRYALHKPVLHIFISVSFKALKHNTLASETNSKCIIENYNLNICAHI